MNSTTDRDFVEAFVKERFNVLKVEHVDPRQIAFEINEGDVTPLLSALKQAGWRQLSYLSAVDWIEEEAFELVYILFNWEQPVYIQVRTRIDRNNPKTQSIMPVYPGAKYYERETHEFFGIHFEGNPDYEKQLILENWDDLPPLRKDFDPQAYSDKTFPKRSYKHDHVKPLKNQAKVTKKTQRKARAESLRGGGRS
jgi:NADH-quinone oxidoreductase subunit C